MNNEIILVTGAGQGIGKAISQALAAPDRTLILADLNPQTLSQTASELKSKCRDIVSFVGDLSDDNARNQMVSEVLAKYKCVDVLVNNAGVTHKPKLLEEIEDAEYDFNFKINTKLPFQLMKAFLPAMKAQKHGLIINMSSSANVSGYADLSVYSATKAALSSLTDSVAKEAGDQGIIAVAVLPSRTNTPMQEFVRGKEVAATSQPPEFVASIIAKIVSGEIPVRNGDDIRIKDGNFIVEADINSKQD